MSWYVRHKVLRVPINACGLEWLEAVSDAEYALREKYPGAISYKDIGKFNVTYTTNGWFLDYQLEYEYDCDGEYGKVRDLDDSEKKMYRPVFQLICPEIDMDKVRLVEYCYYNCCEPDGYYDITIDPFYQKLPFICSITGLQ
jgi:hypothetical protein